MHNTLIRKCWLFPACAALLVALAGCNGAAPPNTNGNPLLGAAGAPSEPSAEASQESATEPPAEAPTEAATIEATPSLSGVIVFVSQRDGDDEIYRVNADGGDLRRLTADPGQDIMPEWSPDGSRIAFASSRDGNLEIYVMGADGSTPIRLTNSAGKDANPVWSPDGTQIAFESFR